MNFEDCYVAYLDMLGVTNLMSHCENDEFLRERFCLSLLEVANTRPFYSMETDFINPDNSGAWTLQSQVMSDCIVLFIPVRSKHIGHFLNKIRILHDRLLHNCVLLRGTVTIGKMLWSSDWSEPVTEQPSMRRAIAFGPGLVEAAHMEEAVAKNPIVILSESMVAHIASQITANDSRPFCTGLVRHVVKTIDGQPPLGFLDFLSPNIRRPNHLQSMGHPNAATEELNTDTYRDAANTDYESYLKIVRSSLIQLLKESVSEAAAVKVQWFVQHFNNTIRGTDLEQRIGLLP